MQDRRHCRRAMSWRSRPREGPAKQTMVRLAGCRVTAYVNGSHSSSISARSDHGGTYRADSLWPEMGIRVSRAKPRRQSISGAAAETDNGGTDGASSPRLATADGLVGPSGPLRSPPCRRCRNRFASGAAGDREAAPAQPVFRGGRRVPIGQGVRRLGRGRSSVCDQLAALSQGH